MQQFEDPQFDQPSSYMQMAQPKPKAKLIKPQNFSNSPSGRGLP